ncbi:MULTISPECIES: murein L,D-transpeptidase catalytic domain family protein [Niastella]|uniref:Murein L,D-transpeptidase catalytic domain family protein n=1 Tax=Niastella soli TaxID=2821487 RepID=A0ABS3YU18_9BACT|nr:murein L,D-transpeptidase catalytic domain family protein [Niastella soli]MBO9201383.1 murein L,D-transpeptidase catalytic domain family protein [Niastella soli]
MQKPLIVTPGKQLRLFLMGLVALLSTFTPTKAGNRTANGLFSDTSYSAATAHIFSISNKLNVYDSLHLKDMGLSKKVFTMALKGMAKLVRTRHIKDNLLAIVDFSQPSINKRLYVIDLNTYQLLYNTWVAHGMKTGKDKAISFSNKMSSNKSSLGFYVTGLAYNGSNGYSLKLQGMEKGINDGAMRRGIVIHGADYVNEDLINSQGYIGRSWGCPAVAPEVSQPLIDLLKEGSCLFIYASNTTYQSRSAFVK